MTTRTDPRSTTMTWLRALRPTARTLGRPLATFTLAVALVGAAALPALAFPGGHGGHGPMGMGPGMMGERMMDAVNATPEQRAQLKQIYDAARRDLQAQREAGRALREQAQALFTQPTVDARAAEVLRQQMLAQHDQSSKRMLQAMLDASRVLTPEQRKQLADRMAQRRAMMDRHRGEREQLERR